jgi:hypothetical protein
VEKTVTVRPKMPRPVSVSLLLDGAIAGTPLAQRLREGTIWNVWDKAVGEQIAQRAQPVAFRSGILTVIVDSPPWMQQLTFMKQQIVEKINTALGEELVQEMYLKAGKPEPQKMKTAKKPLKDLSSEDKEFIRAQSGSISDDDLQQALASLMAYHLRSR